jgi:hypothetical protein
MKKKETKVDDILLNHIMKGMNLTKPQSSHNLRKLNTEPPIGASHFGHLAKQLQRRKYLEIDQSETRMACGSHVKKSSPLKPLGQMNRNLVGSILGRSFIKIANLVPIH